MKLSNCVAFPRCLEEKYIIKLFFNNLYDQRLEAAIEYIF